MQKKVSVILVNYNGKVWLDTCLSSLSKQTYSNYEIIFVDNCSTDNSVKFVNKKFPNIKVIINPANYGFAKGNNIGFDNSSGDYVIFLNTDTKVPDNYIENFVKVFKEHPKCAIAQSKVSLMNDPNSLDACGSFWTKTTLLVHTGFRRKDSKNYSVPMKVFAIKGASMIARRDCIDKIGLFDEDFWCYYEETDLCVRVWISGYECWYWPKAICSHAVGGTSSKLEYSFVQYFNFKNKITSFIKTFEPKNLIWILLLHMGIIMSLSLYWLVIGKWKNVKEIWRAVFWNISNLRVTLKKRKLIQNIREVDDKWIFKNLSRNPPIIYFLYQLTLNEKFNIYDGL